MLPLVLVNDPLGLLLCPHYPSQFGTPAKCDKASFATKEDAVVLALISGGHKRMQLRLRVPGIESQGQCYAWVAMGSHA